MTPDPETLAVELAAPTDIDGILAVQEENMPENGGSLSARFPRAWFEDAIAKNFIVVARDRGRVAGYVAFTPREAQAHVPIIQAMLVAYPSPDAYLHGPICVGKDFRRRGLATAMFRAQREHMKHSGVIAFIREDNHASRNAHRGMGMHEAATFKHGGVRYVVVAA
jgi:predicted N-acetyltransferase YhbS